jgi:uncharacterized protein YjbI with pentapeptide repeats
VQDHLSMLMKGVGPWNRWREDNPRITPRFASAEIQGINLAHAKLRNADLRRAKIQGVNLTQADLSGAMMQGVDLTGADLSGAHMIRADLTGARLKHAQMSFVEAIDATFRAADLWAVSLYNAHLLRADFREARLETADMQRVGAHEAQFERAKMHRVNLREARLNGARLDNVDLRSAILQYATLDDAHLTHSKLWDVQRAGWSIKGIECAGVFWDKDAATLTRYGPGRFERLHADSATIELRYPDGITQFELHSLPLLLHKLASQHADGNFRLRSIEETADGATVVLVVEEMGGSALQTWQDSALRLQEAQLEARRNKSLVSLYQAQVELLTEKIFPTLLEATKMKRITFNAPVGAYFDGGTHEGITINQSLAEPMSVKRVVSEVMEHWKELSLPRERLTSLEQAARRAQDQLKSPSEDSSVLHEALKTIRNVLEEAAGSMMSTAIYPTITTSWLPFLAKTLDGFR